MMVVNQGQKSFFGLSLVVTSSHSGADLMSETNPGEPQIFKIPGCYDGVGSCCSDDQMCTKLPAKQIVEEYPSNENHLVILSRYCEIKTTGFSLNQLISELGSPSAMFDSYEQFKMLICRY
jgi:hypothetical protein